MIPLFKPSLGQKEYQAVIKTLKSGWLGSGPKVAQFEKKMAQLTNTKHAIALNSATAALHLSLLTSIKPGDQVISPSLTFVAANQAILHAGGKIVFADVDPDTLCSDPKDILGKITKNTRAIIVMHYGGHPVDIKPLLKVSRQKKITLIEDCAHAAGSYYHQTHVGGFGDLGCFSFAAIKNLTTGDGGMIVTNDHKKAKHIRQLAWSGISSSTWKRYSHKLSHKWEYDVKSLGFKYQMNDIAASLGLVQFSKLKSNNLKRKRIFKRYHQAFKNLDWLKSLTLKPWAKSSYHNYFIKVSQKIRNPLIEYLNSNQVSANVHYLPNHKYNMFKQFSAKVPITNQVWQEIVLLPIFPDLNLKDQQKVINLVKSFK